MTGKWFEQAVCKPLLVIVFDLVKTPSTVFIGILPRLQQLVIGFEDADECV